MTTFNKKSAGSYLADYVLPFILIGLVFGVSLYILNKTGLIKTNVVAKLEAKFDNANNNLMEDQNTKVLGLYKNIDNYFYFNTLSGKSVYIPPTYYEAIKDASIKYLSENSDKKNDTDINEPKIWDISQSSEFYTGQYSSLINTLAMQVKEPVNKSLLDTLSEYGYKLAQLEAQLTTIRNKLAEAKLNYEISKLTYQDTSVKWKKVWIRHFECLDNPKAHGCAANSNNISDAFREFNNSYISFKNATDTYKKVSLKYSSNANSCYNDLKNGAGKTFDLLLDNFKKRDLVSPEIKSIVLVFGGEIKSIKNNIKMEKTSITELKSVIKVNNPVVKENFDYFDSFDITINDQNTGLINCVAECIYYARDDCKDLCNN